MLSTANFTSIAKRQGFDPEEAARRGQAVSLLLRVARRQGYLGIQQALVAVGEGDVWDDILGGRYPTVDVIALVALLLDADDPDDMQGFLDRHSLPSYSAVTCYARHGWTDGPYGLFP